MKDWIPAFAIFFAMGAENHSVFAEHETVYVECKTEANEVQTKFLNNMGWHRAVDFPNENIWRKNV